MIGDPPFESGASHDTESPPDNPPASTHRGGPGTLAASAAVGHTTLATTEPAPPTKQAATTGMTAQTRTRRPQPPLSPKSRFTINLTAKVTQSYNVAWFIVGWAEGSSRPPCSRATTNIAASK
jgi:hypothetical protein